MAKFQRVHSLKLCHNYHLFSGYLTYGVAAVQVQVNGLTGQVDVLSADLVMDLGTVYLLGHKALRVCCLLLCQTG